MDNKIYSVLTPEEKAIFTLRALYADYGYEQYKMSKFEEYDLYVKNKDFLVSKNIIAFTDTDGRLLALKPDVTLSIIKNSKDTAGKLIKAQYNENVYRISGGTNSFKELMQAGVECIGAVDEDEIAEVIMLAAKSLDTISESNVLTISQLDIAEGVMNAYGISDAGRAEMLKYLGQKNSSGIKKIARSEGKDERTANRISSLCNIYGICDEVIPRLEDLRVDDFTSSAINSLISVVSKLKTLGVYEKLRIDFSIVSDMNYYNGIAMKGFVESVPASVISGGQYDNLMRKMGRSSKAIGFAVYLDELERFFRKAPIREDM